MAIARHEILCTLEDVIRESANLLKPNGRFYMVHRPFRLAEIFVIMNSYRLEPKRMQLVYPFADKEPNMVLIEGVKDGNPMLKITPPLIVYRPDGTYTDELLALYGMTRKIIIRIKEVHYVRYFIFMCYSIGNLEDITLRVLRTLQEVDVIAAEDTRNTIKLLNHFEIKTPMTSYHEYNKVDKAAYLVEQLANGKNIALVTDAGTPAISDPGEELVKQAYAAGIPVTSLPGACACVTALTLSGLSTRRFAFEAFLPSDKKLRRKILDSLCTRNTDSNNL